MTKRIRKSGITVKDRLRNIHQGMKQRCHNPNNNAYYRYGGRGIKVCVRWRSSFEHFYTDMHKSYEPGLTIERVNNDGDYSPSNCKWILPAEQAANKSSNRKVTVKGETMILVRAIEKYGVLPSSTITNRINRGGWDNEKAILEPATPSRVHQRMITFKDVTDTLTNIFARFSGQPYETVRARLSRGWLLEDALLTDGSLYQRRTSSNQQRRRIG